MPRYHFTVHDGTDEPDREGTELPGLIEARREATRLIGELLRDRPGALQEGDRWWLDVSDEDGALLFSISLSVRDSQA